MLGALGFDRSLSGSSGANESDWNFTEVMVSEGCRLRYIEYT